tara:strand:- start:340 stop:861 length:522 start_codon:yes stop_codon:yes gene_type:complete
MSDEENCDCPNCDAEFSNNEQIQVIKSNQRLYYVTTVYIKADTENTFFSSNVFTTDEKIITSRYRVYAIDVNAAIQHALEIDKMRKMMILTQFYKVLDKQDKVEFTMETVTEFHTFILENKAFHDFYLSEPSSIQACLVDNEDLIISIAANGLEEVSSHVADDVEQWLKNNDN